MSHIGLLPQTFDVSQIASELDSHPELWNQYRGRLNHPQSPHRESDDIWLRFAEENLEDREGKVDGPHKSVWYPSATLLPSAQALAIEIFTLAGGKELGGVILLRVPPGKQIYPHVDSAWHARYYEKIAVQISGDKSQRFEFEDSSLSARTGQSYWLDNSAPHWVLNPSPIPWTNMTVCFRR